MAESAAHKFGQIIGDLIEAAIEPRLEDFCSKNGLYLDSKGPRPSRGVSKKVSWTDDRNNKHDLDFVIERGGTKESIGSPIAFIEIAWRRYTKHSRNKAQEIQGAIIPLAQKYHDFAPFTGVVLAGDFTGGALRQLKSLGFSVLYFPYKSIIKAFRKVGIDAFFDERTPEKEFREKLWKWDRLSSSRKQLLQKTIIVLNRRKADKFMQDLRLSVERKILELRILCLYGKGVVLGTVGDAIAYIAKYRPVKNGMRFLRFEIAIKFSNGDEINGVFSDRTAATKYLRVAANSTKQ